MKYQDNILCLTYDELVPDLMPEGTYKTMRFRNNITVIGRGGNGREALITYEGLPHKYQLLVQAKYGNPYEFMAKQPVIEKFQAIHRNNATARSFFEGLRDRGEYNLTPEHIDAYTKAASMLDMITEVMEDKKWIKRELNISLDAFWSMFYTEYEWKEHPDGSRTKIGTRRKGLIELLDVSLPASDKLKKKWKAYKEEGYACLLNGRFNNDAARKVDEKLEWLILSLYAEADPKPYASDVCLQYLSFLEGKRQIVHLETGELFNQRDFYRDDQPVMLAEATVKHYLNKPANRILVDKVRTSGLEFSSTHRPHAFRKAPEFTFSKISMDDIAVPFKMPDGTRVWSYQIYEVASQAVVGVAFARDKSVQLVKDAVLDMVRRIVQNGWGMPAEIEVEQHLNSTLKGSYNEDGEFTPDLLTEGVVFPFVRFCRGANPQEKRAEGFIKAKKYGVQAKRKGFQRRPFARLEANRMNADQDKVTYTFDEIVANEMQDIAAHNAALHPNEHLYPGLTRWDVLTSFQNPKLHKPSLITVLPFVGYRTETSIRRSMYVNVKYNKYMLPDPRILESLVSQDVDAYYLPAADGTIQDVYLYQKGTYICKCALMEAFQEAEIERTDKDRAIMEKQFSYIAKFDHQVKVRRAMLSKVATVPTETVQQIQAIGTNEVESVQEIHAEEMGYVQKNDSKNHWWLDSDEIERRAINNL